MGLEAPMTVVTPSSCWAFFLRDGKNFITMDEVVDTYTPAGQASAASGVYWELGDSHVKIRRLAMAESYGVWGNEPTNNSNGQFWYEGDLLASTNMVAFYQSSSTTVPSPNFKSWVTVKEVLSSPVNGLGVSVVGLGKVYVDAQKVSGGQTAITSSGYLWARVMKVAGPNSLLTLAGGSNVVAVQEYEALAGDATALMTLSGGNNRVTGGILRSVPSGITAVNVTGGTNLLEGMTIDTTMASATSYPITVANSNLFLKDVWLSSPGGVDGIFASSARTVFLTGSLYTTNTVNVNVALRGMASTPVYKAANYTVNPGDPTIYVNTANATNTLPSAAGRAGVTFRFKLTAGTNAALLAPAGQFIDGATNIFLTYPGSTVTVESDGTNWWTAGGALNPTYGFYMDDFSRRRTALMVNNGANATLVGYGDTASLIIGGQAILGTVDAVSGQGLWLVSQAIALASNGCSGNKIWKMGRSPQAQTSLYLTNVASTIFCFGWSDQTTAVMLTNNPAGNYAVFRYSTTASDTKFQCITKDGATQTVTDSGVTVTVNTLYVMEVACQDWLGQVLFRINGVNVATNKANRPTAGTLLGHVLGQQTLTTLTNGFKCEWIQEREGAATF